MSRAPRAMVALWMAAAVSGCGAALPPASFEGTSPEFQPDAFFLGTTVSAGVLEDRAGAPTDRFTVSGHGALLPDGSLELVQRISFEGKAPTERSWVLHRIDAHHYAATLTDAAGPVRAEAYGSLFHLNYDMKSPVLGHMEQWLYLQPDGQTVVNEATVSLLGITVAHLSERISHIPDPAAHN